MRQLVLYGRDGLPVMSIDGQQLEGWLTSPNVLQAIARQMATALAAATPPAHLAAGWALADQQPAPDDAPVPLRGYQVVEVTIGHGSPAVGHTLGETTWPPGWVPVSVLDDHTLRDPDPGVTLDPGDRVNLLGPVAAGPAPRSHPTGPEPSPACPKRHPRPRPANDSDARRRSASPLAPAPQGQANGGGDKPAPEVVDHVDA